MTNILVPTLLITHLHNYKNKRTTKRTEASNPSKRPAGSQEQPQKIFCAVRLKTSEYYNA
jgi:hypothetical protein